MMIMTKSPNLDFCLFGVGLAISGLEVHDDHGNSYLCNKLLLVEIKCDMNCVAFDWLSHVVLEPCMIYTVNIYSGM